MKIIDIDCPYDWEDIDPENHNIDVFVKTDDGSNYNLPFTTPRNF